MERFEIAFDDMDYPSGLREVHDPPSVLYGIGDIGLLGNGLAIIGSRKATPYGLAATRLFAGFAAARGIPIVSGAALGCDQEAHRSALAANGPTVAVLGCGSDVDYPSGAAKLLDQIREHGVVVSEVSWGTKPKRWLFPRRNRLIAGLSTGVLVVEASLPSGTFSTADYALDYGRTVMAVPGSIFSPQSRGANRLLAQGATPVSDVSELSFALGIGEMEQLAFDDSEHHPLLRALLADPMRPDDAARSLDLHIVEVARLLGAFEAKGLVARYPDGRYGPCLSMKRAIQSAHAQRDQP